jgi:GT2 family glycosyltransferase
MAEVSVSVVSHGQAEMTNRLVSDIARYAPEVEVLVTRNIPEAVPIYKSALKNFSCLDNSERKGFGANHNAAFRRASSPYFCIINPDVRLLDNPFPKLLECFGDRRVGLVTAKVVNSLGNVEDSVRYFPTPIRLAAKCLGLGEGRYPTLAEIPIAVDWSAGMFMLFRAEAFREIDGFDENFFLYYEDVDICARLWKARWKVMHHPGVSVVHDAQRASRSNIRYLKWHLASMARYFYKYFGRIPHIDNYK